MAAFPKLLVCNWLITFRIAKIVEQIITLYPRKDHTKSSGVSASAPIRAGVACSGRIETLVSLNHHKENGVNEGVAGDEVGRVNNLCSG